VKKYLRLISDPSIILEKKRGRGPVLPGGAGVPLTHFPEVQARDPGFFVNLQQPIREFSGMFSDCIELFLQSSATRPLFF